MPSSAPLLVYGCNGLRCEKLYFFCFRFCPGTGILLSGLLFAADPENHLIQFRVTVVCKQKEGLLLKSSCHRNFGGLEQVLSFTQVSCNFFWPQLKNAATQCKEYLSFHIKTFNLPRDTITFAKK